MSLRFVLGEKSSTSILHSLLAWEEGRLHQEGDICRVWEKIVQRFNRGLTLKVHCKTDSFLRECSSTFDRFRVVLLNLSSIVTRL